MNASRIGNSLLAAVGLTAACATAQPASNITGTTIDERPGQLLGPDARLSLEGGVLAGQIKGGRYEVKMVPGGAQGSGPLGRVDVRIEPVAQGYHVDGIWNGARISFVVGKNAIRGNALRQVSDEDRGLENCWYDVEKLWRRTVYAGHETCPGLDEPVRFDLKPATSLGLDDETTAVLMIAFLVAPPLA
jgi:hypothetical protein